MSERIKVLQLKSEDVCYLYSALVVMIVIQIKLFRVGTM